jgi:hypothetical protein
VDKPAKTSALSTRLSVSATPDLLATPRSATPAPRTDVVLLLVPSEFRLETLVIKALETRDSGEFFLAQCVC